MKEKVLNVVPFGFTKSKDFKVNILSNRVFTFTIRVLRRWMPKGFHPFKERSEYFHKTGLNVSYDIGVGKAKSMIITTDGATPSHPVNIDYESICLIYA